MNGKAELLQFFRKNKISVLPNLSGYGNIFCVRSSAGCKSGKALTDEAGAIEKIQWTGYIENVKQYQGSLINKVAVQKRFYGLTDESIKNSSDLQIVCDHIIEELGRIPSVNASI